MTRPLIRRFVPISLMLSFILLLGTAQTVVTNAQEYTAAWNQSMVDEFETAYGHIKTIEAQLDRLDKEVAGSRAEIAANPDCAEFDCEPLRRLAEIADKADAAARSAELLGHIALGQQERQIDHTKKIVSAIEKGRDRLATVLLAQEVALGVAELSFSMYVAAVSGDPQTALSGFSKVADIVKRVAAPGYNFAANKAADYIVPVRPALNDGAGNLAKRAGAGQFGQDLAAGLTREITRFGVLDYDHTIKSGNKLLFRPRASVFDLTKKGKLSLPNLKSIRAMPEVINATFRVTTRLLTGGAVAKSKERLQRAEKELEDAIGAQRDYATAVVMQKLHNKELQRLRRNYLILKARAEEIRSRCRQAALKNSCGKTLSASLDAANSIRNGSVEAVMVRRDAAARAVAEARATWMSQMEEVHNLHVELRQARDGVTETELMAANREKIRELAIGAGSAAVREKYRRQLDDLNARKPLGEQRARVALLAKRRDALWSNIEKQRTAVGRLSRVALAVFSETAESVDQAERVYFAAVSKARSVLIDCLGQNDNVERADRASLKKLRKATGNLTLVPHDIFSPVNTALSDLGKTAAVTRISVIRKPESTCQKIARSGLDGCWFDVTHGGDENRSRPVTISTNGDRIFVMFERTKRRYTGTVQGDWIRIAYKIAGPMDLATFRWGLGDGKAPPMKVLRQIYPKHQVARSSWKRNEVANVLSGQSHGAYVTWGRESLKLSSYTPRDYPEKLVRDHRLKIRRVMFAGEDGQQRTSQSASDRLHGVAVAARGCPSVIDTVRVKSYVNGDPNNFVWDTLRETGPDTLEFRGDLPALRAMVSAMPADRIKSITLLDPKALRGATLRVTQ